MKTFEIMLTVVVLAVIGYFAFTQKAPETKPSQTATTTTSAEQGKLNIDVVCASALTYMTFENSVSADAFVAECKQGKHPEVIEHFKAQMNLGDGATI